jgi:uncharacterized protein (TIGR02246 family)
MHDSLKFVRPFIVIFILGTGWVCYAQVKDAGKTVPLSPVKKAEPAVDATKKPVTDAAGVKAIEPKKTDDRQAAAEKRDDKAIRDSADAFAKAYNEHNSKAISQLFAIKAEVTDEVGNVVKGREAIEQDFAQTFVRFPEAKIQIEIGSIRFLTPNIAVEEGIVRGIPVPDQSENVSGYIAVHVKVEGNWVIASVSDFESPVELTAHDHLQELSWLLGDWIEESPDSAMKTSCRWDESGNYLIQDFSLHAPGVAFANGSMRIGWDALRSQFKSWVFNADGGHAEGYWTRDGDSWTVKSHGVNAKGEPTSSTSVYRYLDNDTMTWRAYDRVVGGTHHEQSPEFIVKRHAPQPGT